MTIQLLVPFSETRTPKLGSTLSQISMRPEAGGFRRAMAISVSFIPSSAQNPRLLVGTGWESGTPDKGCFTQLREDRMGSPECN